MPLTVLSGAALLAPVVLATSACGSSHAIAGPLVRVSANRVSESQVVENGTVRCTATVLTTPAQAGHALGDARVVFVVHNLTKRRVLISDPEGSAVVTSPDGTTYDSLWELEHSPANVFGPSPLAPRATTKEKVFFQRVSWEGPLRVTPSCGSSTFQPVQIGVTSPGFPASPRAAVTDAVEATGHLLDHCRPRTPGLSVVGRIDPASGNLPPLRARCSVSLHRERGFYRAQVLVVTPPSLRGIHILPTYEDVRHPDIRHRNTEVIAWQFVVTRRGARSINSFVGTTATQTRVWTNASDEGDGIPLCGVTGGSGGGSGRPQIEFLSSKCVAQKP